MHLTKTDKKGKEKKTKLVEEVRDCVDSHSRVYAFAFTNMRTAKFKDLRAALKDSRFFLGKNKVMQLALGRTPEEEYREGLSAISRVRWGDCRCWRVPGADGPPPRPAFPRTPGHFAATSSWWATRGSCFRIAVLPSSTPC